MKILHLFFFFLFVFIIVGILFGSIYFLITKALISVQQGLELSPVEDGLLIEDKSFCEDSDQGIFISRKGTLLLEQKFLFIKWDIKLEDSCDGDELTEYYCSEIRSIVGQGVVNCPNGCENGICK